MTLPRFREQFLLANRILKNSKNESGASERKLWFRSDLIVIAALLIAAVLAYFVYAAVSSGSGTAYCEILLDGEIVMTVRLDRDKAFTIPQKPNIEFETKDGAIAFIRSDCPDKVCVNSGFLHQAGQHAACLPNHIAIRIKTENDAGSPDVVI